MEAAVGEERLAPRIEPGERELVLQDEAENVGADAFGLRHAVERDRVEPLRKLFRRRRASPMVGGCDRGYEAVVVGDAGLRRLERVLPERRRPIVGEQRGKLIGRRRARGGRDEKGRKERDETAHDEPPGTTSPHPTAPPVESQAREDRPMIGARS